MMHDLWDVEAGFYFRRFASEDDALKFFRDLIDANGDAYADALELGSPDDPSANRSVSGAVFVERARRLERIA